MNLIELTAQAGPAGDGGEISSVFIWVGLLALLVIIFLLIRTFGPKRLEKRRPQELPPKEPVAERDESAAPEALEPGERRPTLREVKEAKSKRITEELKTKEALLKAREARKGKVAPAPEPAPKRAEVATDDEGKAAPPQPAEAEPQPEAAPAVRRKTLKEGLEKTRTGGFVGRLRGLFSKRKKLDSDLMGELEEVLFTADIGVKTSQDLLEAVEKKMGEQSDGNSDAAWTLLREETARILRANQSPFEIGEERPYVVLIIGVNGVGKTTTIGKLASKLKAKGLKVSLIAGDTFRAAAIDQLKVWGQRTGCKVFAGKEKADPSAVVFDGLKEAAGDGTDVVLVDTAGRLHTKVNLVEELKKVQRVSGKALEGAPHQVLLVLDANTGQNAINQADMFNKEVGVTGIVLTKLDGTAKGGVIIGISDELGVPVQYIGIGEQVDDLREFDADEFIDAMF